MGNLIPALILGLIATAIVVYMAGVVFKALFRDFQLGDYFFNKTLRTRRLALQESADLFSDKRWEDCIQSLTKSFFTEAKHYKRHTLSKIHNHHMEVLAHVVTITEDLPGSIENLPLLEELLLKRLELFRAKYDVIARKGTVQQKAQESGKDVPEWGIREFGKKLSELEESIKVNEMSIEKQLDELFSKLFTAEEIQKVTYH